MQKRIWRNYNRELVNRGSITFYIDADSLKNLSPTGKRGRPKLFGNLIIQMLLLARLAPQWCQLKHNYKHLLQTLDDLEDLEREEFGAESISEQ